MHEMSIVMNFVDIAEQFAKKHNAKRVDKVVIQVGELSGVVPSYLYEFYPTVVEGTYLDGSKLVVETVKASVFCTKCATTYNPSLTDMKCPKCGSMECDIIDGQSILVKEIAMEIDE